MAQKKTEKLNAHDFIQKISQEIEATVPPHTQMITDLKMMRFKIRPLAGDLFSLSQKTSGSLFVSLWRIGKIEETVRLAFEILEEGEMEALFDYVDELQKRFNQGFGYDENGTFFADARPTRLLKLEIFREPEVSYFSN